MGKPIKTLELHYQMIQFLMMTDRIPVLRTCIALQRDIGSRETWRLQSGDFSVFAFFLFWNKSLSVWLIFIDVEP